MTATNHQVDRLKAEGNALFKKKAYNAAIAKFTEALELDEENVALYSNRSACYISLHAYGQAASDAITAIDIDPGFTKAWGRLATAQHGYQDYNGAVRSWQGGIDTLSDDADLTADAKQLKEEYLAHLETEMMNASAFSASPEAAHGNVRVVDATGKTLPWQRGEGMLDRLLNKAIVRSSAYVIVAGRRRFEEGMRKLSVLRSVKKAGGYKVTSDTGILAIFTNAILQDERCFAVSQGDFFPRIHQQIQFELNMARSPKLSKDSQAFIAEIRNLHAKGGHSISRRALTTGIRALIFYAYADAVVTDDYAKATFTYDKVISILRWGRQEWNGVPKEDRGAVLGDTFVNGVRHAYLQAYMKALTSPDDANYLTLAEMLREAESLIEDIRAQGPLTSPDLGSNLSYGDYMEGHAIAIKGHYWNLLARSARYDTAEQVEEGQERLRISSKYYFEASEKFPDDEEYRAYYMMTGLDLLFRSAVPLNDALPLIRALRRAIPLTLEIWQFSSHSHDDEYAAYDEFYYDVLNKLATGKVTMDDIVYPTWANPRDMFGDALEARLA